MFAINVTPLGRISLKEGYFQVTHTCFYVTIRPNLNSKREIVKTAHVQKFFVICCNGKNQKRKLSTEKSGGHLASNKNILTSS